MHMLAGGPARVWNVFLAWENWKNLELFDFLRCIQVIDLVLKYGSDINEGNWLQLLFYFTVLTGIVDSVIGMCFFQLCFRFWIEVFSYCSLTETFAIGFQKWFDHEWIDFKCFWWKMASFVDLISVWTEICKNCPIFFRFWRHQFFSIFSLRVILVCFSKMLVLLAIEFFNVYW